MSAPNKTVAVALVFVGVTLDAVGLYLVWIALFVVISERTFPGTHAMGFYGTLFGAPLLYLGSKAISNAMVRWHDKG